MFPLFDCFVWMNKSAASRKVKSFSELDNIPFVRLNLSGTALKVASKRVKFK